jgi:hypothetical protein
MNPLSRLSHHRNQKSLRRSEERALRSYETQAELDPNEPVCVGLRSMGNGSVCLEQEAARASSTTTATAARASACRGAARTR